VAFVRIGDDGEIEQRFTSRDQATTHVADAFRDTEWNRSVLLPDETYVEISAHEVWKRYWKVFDKNVVSCLHLSQT